MVRLFNRYFPIRSVIFFGSESLIIFSSILVATLIRFSFEGKLIFSTNFFLVKILIVTLICQVSLFYNSLYLTNMEKGFRQLFIKLFQSLGAATVLLALFYYLFPPIVIGRGIFMLTVLLLPMVLLIWRFLFGKLSSINSLKEKVLIVGTGDLAKEIGKQIVERGHAVYQVVGYIDADPRRLGQSMFNPKIIGDYDRLVSVVQKEEVGRVIIALPERRGYFPTSALLKCKLDGVEIEEGVSFYERMNGRILVNHLKPGWLIFSDGFKRRGLLVTKRLTDLVLASVLLILTSPIMLLTALLIKLESKGSVFYRQKRVGQNGRLYTLLKFRSMRVGAEKETGPVWAQAHDSRTTWVGKWIRKARIDELPQVINVLRGEMSFIGPRPERPYFVSRLRKQVPYYTLRYTVKPGITGWAQVRYPYGASVKDALAKLEYDLFYIKNMSFLFDMTIVMETFKIVFLGKGAR